MDLGAETKLFAVAENQWVLISMTKNKQEVRPLGKSSKYQMVSYFVHGPFGV